jgi:uncharacterized membrane protein
MRFLPASSPWAAVLPMAQIAAIAWFATRRLLAVAAAALIASVGLFALHLPPVATGLVTVGLSHFTAYAALLCWFAPSLREGSEPVITGFARQMRKTMPPAVERYTRAVTIAWCVFFAAQILISITLALTGDTGAWLAFVTVWSLPSVAIMALGEYGVRSCLFARSERTGFLATQSALRDIRPS